MHKKTYTQIVMNLLQPQYHKSLSHLELCIIINKSTHKIEVYGMSKTFPSLHSIEIATRSHYLAKYFQRFSLHGPRCKDKFPSPRATMNETGICRDSNNKIVAQLEESRTNCLWSTGALPLVSSRHFKLVQ